MENASEKQSLMERIEKALDGVRPYLEADGGNIILLDVNESMQAKVKLTGNCESCPMSESTLKSGVEEAIKFTVPEISGLIAVDSEGNESLV